MLHVLISPTFLPISSNIFIAHAFLANNSYLNRFTNWFEIMSKQFYVAAVIFSLLNILPNE
ncbi:MAG: hypothetical protein A2499_14315 [Stygiobacter sp. RIFOXYC12_FULL_38_8]|nr:MAG: hypothetical protein A2X62_01590 [Stygiobacter sp. GWC2_38_9]OGU84997.1 MAG: hypothetical protein A2279_14210 [Stygiobacter sp. RIFOXYA12_FULL_38_9]OGV07754.1 MAG: hypothetical protein A2299_06235 [Stygiobacter sp. RIFOXYB2_FULL_37_11]OGV11619.1 MAG: hypothetical protein A2237_17690 [Stygiobacter sp. RIFOXYA2_FULL_38_8]OGV12757.1 MAG: hypothetical protein A2440_16070 [Stygiobacter sp. RIFOXYC2_FULL_38_25]OGV27014.1 MAG: hypothetical protein A2499_14315 [Stygiobacter sp. RIFOXYC12_FULL_